MRPKNTNPYFTSNGMTQLDNPCKDCEKREVGCHQNCKLYKKYKVLLNEMKHKEQRNKERSKWQ